MESSKNDKNWSRKAGWVALAATTLLTAFFCFWRLGADTILGFDEGRHVAMPFLAVPSFYFFAVWRGREMRILFLISALPCCSAGFTLGGIALSKGWINLLSWHAF